jgi:hypothetical protein
MMDVHKAGDVSATRERFVVEAARTDAHVERMQHHRDHVTRDGSLNLKATWPRFGGW